MEFPACIAGIFMMSKLGCRPTLSGGLILCGFTCLITGIVPEGKNNVLTHSIDLYVCTKIILTYRLYNYSSCFFNDW